MPPDRFDYNEAIARSSKEQLLINLVRLRYDDVPVFLAVDSVLTQYVYAGDVTLTGSVGRAAGDSLSTFTGALGAAYLERPTVTYSPVTGEKFAEQMLSPMPEGLILSLVQSGWPAYEVLIMSLERLNDLQNLTFEPNRPGADEELRKFGQAVRLLIELAGREAVGTRTRSPEKPDGPQLSSLVFESNPDEGTRALVDRFKALLGLDPERSEFRITHDIVGRQPDEITIRVRSLLALMSFLAQGVEAPAVHSEQGLTGGAYPPDEAVRSSLIPLHVQVAERRP